MRSPPNQTSCNGRASFWTASRWPSIREKIPALSQMMRTSGDEVIQKSDLIIVIDPTFDWDSAAARLRADQIIIDVEGAGKRVMLTDPRYVGVCW